LGGDVTLISLANRLSGQTCFAPADQPGSSGTRVPVQENHLFEKRDDCHAGDNDLFVFRPRPRRNPPAKQAVSTPAPAKPSNAPEKTTPRPATKAMEKPVVQATPPRPLTPSPPEPVRRPLASTPDPVEPAHVASAKQHRAEQAPQDRQPQATEADEAPLFGGITDPTWRPDNHLGGSLLED